MQVTIKDLHLFQKLIFLKLSLKHLVAVNERHYQGKREHQTTLRRVSQIHIKVCAIKHLSETNMSCPL